METKCSARLGSALFLALLLAGCDDARRDPTAPTPPTRPAARAVAATAVANLYVADFVATAATGVAMNDAGDVTGTSYPDPGCGPFCLPPLETVVWRGGVRIVLPAVPGLTGIYVRGINANGWVAGLAGYPYTTTHAVVWKPSGSTYTAIDLGTLPGTTISEAVGIDDQNRVVGWSRTANFPPTGAPFMWSESTGMIDLAAQGFPNDIPLAISPAGTVAIPGYWYRLGDPASVAALPPPPLGFRPPGTYPTAINDAGDQARFLVSTSTQSLVYLFRFSGDAGWQQISFLGNGTLSRYGVGSITPARDISATVRGTGVIAAGPTGLAQPLAPRLSSAYGGATIGSGGPITSAGQILTRVMIGRSERVMRLVPAAPCGASCIRVSQLAMQAKSSTPGYCAQGGNAYNSVKATLTVTDESGSPLGGVLVSGRFLDDYWSNIPASGTTNGRGVVQFSTKTPCGVGAVAFLVDRAAAGTRSFDRTTGIVTSYVIPQ